MFDPNHPLTPSTPLSRRQLLRGLLAASVVAPLAHKLQAQDQLDSPIMAARGTAPVLLGPTIDLNIAPTYVNFSGAMRPAMAINGSIPAPTLKFREGDEVTIRVTNRLNVPTSLHWHGIILPFQMDGVPGISFQGIAPGETFTYQFTLNQSGTYWYHSHSGFQEMIGMYGALIIEPRIDEIEPVERDYIVQLSDWTDEDPMRVFSKLKMQSDLYNYNQPTVSDFLKDIGDGGLRFALEKRQMWNQMRMNPTDLADLSAATMHYLINGSPSEANWTGIFTPGQRVRLRFINASSNTLFDVRIPNLPMQVVQADGQNVVPVTVDEFRFGPGETYDVLIEPSEQVYTLFAQNMDRSGFVFGTLAVRQGLQAPVPMLDPALQLAMTDMMGTMAEMDHEAHNIPVADIHSHHDAPPAVNEHADHSAHQNMLAVPSKTVRHASSEYGPSVDARVDTPRSNLDDPGIGLRNNGRRVLTLADLRAVNTLNPLPSPTREIELHLTGNMERYSWSIDGLEYGQSTPIHMRKGERIRIILHNDTMMTHPMHLHGMWSDLETDQGELLARRHTLLVQPAQRLSFLVTPNDEGAWAWHCHLMFHMDAGMFRKVLVS